MSTFFCRIGLVILMAFGTTFSFNKSAHASFGDVPITPLAGVYAEPRTDGQTVVWTEGRTGIDPSTAVYAARLADRQIIPVATANTYQYNPDVSGDTVVWTQSDPKTTQSSPSHIYAKSLTHGQPILVGDGSNPSISGDWVAWTAKGVYARNIRTMAPALPLDTLCDPSCQRPILQGPHVIYAYSDIGGTPRHWYLQAAQITGGVRNIDSGPLGTLGGYDISGDLVVYSVGQDVKTMNLTTGARLTIPVISSRTPSNPTTDGRYIFWDYSVFNPNQDPHGPIGGYDLVSRSYFNVIDNTSANGTPQLRNGNLVWTKMQLSNKSLIETAILANLLPTAPQLQTANTADRLYFPQTAHTLAYGFKTFWTQNGGLAVFGYPLTEEFDEVNPDTGTIYTVQYLERQRYEYHPEHRGTLYETELGRLGVAEAQQRSLLTTAPFQAVGNPHDSNCLYFAQTSHTTCGLFKSYWQSHGLEFGDPGVSFRESLALFGYPLSEPFTQDGRIVQYFERAVFEEHAENKPPYNVLLRLLGRNILTQRGW